jgi:hypothetical protein
VFGRRRKLPADLRPDLERDERVLAWAPVAAGGAVVATNRGLWLPLDGTSARLGWHQVHKATWSDGVLTVIGASSAPLTPGSDIQVSTDSTPASFALPSPGDLPKRVRERVTASVAYTNLHQLPRGGAARIVARRISGRDGVSWFVRYEGPVAPDDPAVISATEGLVTAAREGIGMAE